VRTDAALMKISTAGPIDELIVAGDSKSVSSLRGAYIQSVAVGGSLGSVKMLGLVDSFGATIRMVAATKIVSSTDTYGNLNVSLTGVELESLDAPNQTVTVKTSTKKFKHPGNKMASFLSLGGVGATDTSDTSETIVAKAIDSISVRAGAVQLDSIVADRIGKIGTACLSVALKNTSGVVTNVDIPANIAAETIVSGGGTLQMLAVGGNVKVELVENEQDISSIVARSRTSRLTGRVLGGMLGYDPDTERDYAMYVYAGGPSQTNASDPKANIGLLFGSVGVNGNFMAGFDASYQATYKGSVGTIGTSIGGTILGQAWSSMAIAFEGDETHSGFSTFTP
jgi:hypothetical protein